MPGKISIYTKTLDNVHDNVHKLHDIKYVCGICTCTSIKIIKNEIGCRDDTVPKTVGNCIKIIKNEIGCRDDTVPKTVGTRRHCEEHATIFRNPLPTSRFLGVAEDCCVLSILLAVPPCSV